MNIYLFALITIFLIIVNLLFSSGFSPIVKSFNLPCCNQEANPFQILLAMFSVIIIVILFLHSLFKFVKKAIFC